MTDNIEIYNTVAPLRNVASLSALIERVQNRALGLPGMATYFGPSGYGKSTAAVFNTNEYDAYQVQLNDAWTRRKLCVAILTEMGIDPAKNIPDMVDQIAEELAMSERPLLIDEADYLCKFNMIELVRGIYEASNAPIILIGEERLPQKLQKWERVHGRMLDWVGALPACSEDVKHLARIYCPGVELADDFKEKLLREAQHSIRRVCVNLERTKEFAAIEGIDEMTVARWGKREFFATSAPKPRHELV